MTIVFLLVLVGLAFWGFTHLVLKGADLSAFDSPRPEMHGGRSEASPEHAAVVARVQKMQAGAGARESSSARVVRVRRNLEEAFGDRAVDAEVRNVDAGGVPAQWVLAPGADPDRRILYLHGGGFIAGSPKSHRPLTARLSADNAAAVLSVDYRLMPENARADCPDDCCRAYEWILENGPDGSGAPDALFVGGDSAGGNLALVVVAWARDLGHRAADAVIAFSPLTDSSYASPSLRTNIATDPMLGPLFKQFGRVPHWLMLWGSFFTMKGRPADPRFSPVYGDLAGLPPVLVQASASEVLTDDARRWVNKARSAGTEATLQLWPDVVHVFQAFVPDLPEADEALKEVQQFFEKHAPHQSRISAKAS
ncbi:MAG: alpha/beta hydrolase [Deltaproteobacteria bacterium]